MSLGISLKGFFRILAFGIIFYALRMAHAQTETVFYVPTLQEDNAAATFADTVSFLEKLVSGGDWATQTFTSSGIIGANFTTLGYKIISIGSSGNCSLDILQKSYSQTNNSITFSKLESTTLDLSMADLSSIRVTTFNMPQVPLVTSGNEIIYTVTMKINHTVTQVIHGKHKLSEESVLGNSCFPAEKDCKQSTTQLGDFSATLKDPTESMRFSRAMLHLVRLCSAPSPF
jgi:hypothetical protein